MTERGRVEFVSAGDLEALDGYRTLCREEGIIPALESAHAVAYGIRAAASLGRKKIMIINISGRRDKDLFIAAKALDRDGWLAFLKSEVDNSVAFKINPESDCGTPHVIEHSIMNKSIQYPSGSKFNGSRDGWSRWL